jgi:hypothetical protein
MLIESKLSAMFSYAYLMYAKDKDLKTEPHFEAAASRQMKENQGDDDS